MNRFGKLAFWNFIRYQDIRPAPTLVDMPLPRNYLAGVGTTYVDGDDLTIGIGQARNTGDTANILVTSAITKEIDGTWAAGTTAGGMNDGESVGNSDWWHVFVLGKVTNDAYDAGFDTDPAAANLLADAAVVAAGFTTYRRIGSVRTDGSADIIDFTQFGDTFLWKVAPLDYNAGAIDHTGGTTVTLSWVPDDIEITGLLRATQRNVSASNLGCLLVPTAETSITPETASNSLSNLIAPDATDAIASDLVINIDTSSQMQVRQKTDTAVDIDIVVRGWIDTRGRDD